jgi:hypothetical protein
VELEISPEPEDAERQAIAAALARPAEAPSAYSSAWRQAAIVEAVEPDEPT